MCPGCWDGPRNWSNGQQCTDAGADRASVFACLPCCRRAERRQPDLSEFVKLTLDGLEEACKPSNVDFTC